MDSRILSTPLLLRFLQHSQVSLISFFLILFYSVLHHFITRIVLYGTIRYDMVCQVGEVLEPNHVIVNKYSPLNQTDLGDGGYSPNKQEYKHTKMSYKGTAPSTVDKVMITSNENENFIIKVCSYLTITISVMSCHFISFLAIFSSSISMAFLLKFCFLIFFIS